MILSTQEINGNKVYRFELLDDEFADLLEGKKIELAPIQTNCNKGKFYIKYKK